MIKHIYLFTGLGANEKVFHRLDLSGYNITFIQWPTPGKNESIENYATRLISQIKTKRPTLIGLSFGGLMAIEVAKQIDTEKVIVIASAKTKNEIPFYYRYAGKLGINRLLPARVFKRSGFIKNWSFGTTSPSDKELLGQILLVTEPVFLKWAIDKVLHWNNSTLLNNVTHIHGTRDRILPYRFVKSDLTIQNGGHLMTLNNAEELSRMLREII